MIKIKPEIKMRGWKRFWGYFKYDYKKRFVEALIKQGYSEEEARDMVKEWKKEAYSTFQEMIKKLSEKLK